MKNIIKIQFFLNQKLVSIDDKLYSTKDLENKKGKTEFEAVILTAMLQLFKSKKVIKD